MDQGEITIVGVLVPDQWKGNGEISGLALFTNDEKKYVLTYTNQEEELMSMLRRKIEISGLLKSEAQEKTILVTCFRPVSPQETDSICC
ncbi:MAG: hypothetical protein KKD01_13215 [Proteobacteria bacterium]|nr:hypothetical protein [Pseudomonadota bacterium]MBU1137644.1 hypothetical protein [Pseudomonadota bacterium]MBU1233606.1 hypothetical protein [Pseudomonadota bacterium]MBU1418898.1 hypothetical protein [Pseudomonadota bacterium]MBU1455678.1 hypothetical protein [Pseudomonadota bacterium]